jgi:hypothetical protein
MEGERKKVTLSGLHRAGIKSKHISRQSSQTRGWAGHAGEFVESREKKQGLGVKVKAPPANSHVHFSQNTNHKIFGFYYSTRCRYFVLEIEQGIKHKKEGWKERNQSGLRMLHGPYVCKGSGRCEYRSIRRSAREKHGVYEHTMLHP